MRAYCISWMHSRALYIKSQLVSYTTSFTMIERNDRPLHLLDALTSFVSRVMNGHGKRISRQLVSFTAQWSQEVAHFIPWIHSLTLYQEWWIVNRRIRWHWLDTAHSDRKKWCPLYSLDTLTFFTSRVINRIRISTHLVRYSTVHSPPLYHEWWLENE